MYFANRHGKVITSLDEWHRLAKPAAEKHWKPGRSAYELAADWIERDATSRVVELLATRSELAGTELLVGIAEKQTHFDDQGRGPRNHDLLVRASSLEGPLVIGVEGKADEPFDAPLWRWRQDALKRSVASGAPERLDRLTTFFFGTRIDKDRDWPGLACIGYQLLSALAGTLADAHADSAARAVLLIHEFVTTETDDERHQVNARVLDDFLQRLIPSPELSITESPDGWITTPITIRGDGKWMPKALPVSIAKLVTNRRPTTTISAEQRCIQGPS